MGICIPGELGIRHEDTVVVTGNGCENLAPTWAGTPEAPVEGALALRCRSRATIICIRRQP